MAGIPICRVTGRVAGDRFACGKCKPCTKGADAVPEVVKRLLKERDEWMDRCSNMELRYDAVAGNWLKEN